MKKTVTTLLVVATVFLCIPFNVFAVTGGGKTIVSNSYSYNNGDVTVYVRVNGQAAEELYEGQHYYPHNFTVTLANNTNEFQVADASNFSIDLYSGSATAFASNQNSWGSEVTSYSDNMTVPRITMYPSGDLAGHVLVAFNDSDLLVLNPNETRTYNFSINFIQTENVNYTPLNGNFRYSYFTYTGTVGFYARPTSFSGNTIEDFISNDSLPNSAIAYYQYLVQQGIEDQTLYNTIINYLYFNGTLTLPSDGTSTFYTLSNSNINNVITTTRAIKGKKELIDSSIVIDSSNDTSYTLYSYKVPVQITILTDNTNAYNVASNGGWYYLYLGGTNYVINEFQSSLFSNFYVESNGFTISFLSKFIGQTSGKPQIIPAGRYATYIQVDYFYTTTDPNYNYNIQNIQYTVVPSSFIEYSYVDYDYNDLTILAKIKMKLQQLLDTGNYGVNDDITDQAADNQTQEDVIHAQEEQWYQDNETAINAVGLSNYQFSGDQTSGLSGVTSQFTSVWNALDGWTNVYIFVLSLSFAAFVLRHNPFTRRQQNYTDKPKGEST